MAEKKQRTFLLRIDHDLFRALQKLADDELRSLNGQIEYLVREGLEKRRRLTRPPRSHA